MLCLAFVRFWAAAVTTAKAEMRRKTANVVQQSNVCFQVMASNVVAAKMEVEPGHSD